MNGPKSRQPISQYLRETLQLYDVLYFPIPFEKRYRELKRKIQYLLQVIRLQATKGMLNEFLKF